MFRVICAITVMFSYYRQYFLSFVLLLSLKTFTGNTHGMHKPGSSSTTRRGEKTATPVVAGIGSTCRLKCLSRGSVDVQWYIQGKILNRTQDSSSKYSIKRRHNREILSIYKVSSQDAGLFSCVAKHRTNVWRITIKNDNTRGCRSKRSTHEYDVCPKGPETNAEYQYCTPGLDFKNCSSVAGSPEDFRVGQFIYESKLIIQCGWKIPRAGFNDLWGYEVELIGLTGDVSKQQCVQINKKTHTFWSFYNIAYGGEYIIKARSLPSNVFLKRKIIIKEKCQFEEFKNESAVCCSLSDINSTLESNEGKILLTWKVQCPNQELSLKSFKISVTNLQLFRCYTTQDTPDQEPISGTFNYTIRLRKSCRRFNYSIWVYGRDKNNITTEKGVGILVSFPEKTGINRTVQPSLNQLQTAKHDSDIKIIASVTGVLLGVSLVIFFLIYKVVFSKEVIALPTYASDSQGDDNELTELQKKNEKKTVFIIHARCCTYCEEVVSCLGQVLSATNALKVCIDLWETHKIAENPMRWYEKEIKEADWVIILTSEKMKKLYDDEDIPVDTDDLLSIKSQLNLVTGEEKEKPNQKKFILAYFSYNGQSSDIPSFLKSRLEHKLLKDLDRLIFYLLGKEPIRPHRTRPVAILGSPDLNLKKKELRNAVGIAKNSHSKAKEIYQNNLKKVLSM